MKLSLTKTLLNIAYLIYAFSFYGIFYGRGAAAVFRALQLQIWFLEVVAGFLNPVVAVEPAILLFFVHLPVCPQK